MRVVKHIIIRTIEVTNRGDTSSQMQVFFLLDFQIQFS